MMKNEAMVELHDRVVRHQIKGFLAPDEAEALFYYCLRSSSLGPCLEIGSYCGKSTVYLGSACERAGNILFAIDHHRGSEEHQVGEEYHDPELFDPNLQAVDTFPALRRALNIFDLERAVVPVVAPSQVVARRWRTPLGMVFIDGGHSHAQALDDCLTWSRHIISGGILAVHDIFPDPSQGGQGPYLALLAVLAEGGFTPVEQVNSLGILRRN